MVFNYCCKECEHYNELYRERNKVKFIDKETGKEEFLKNLEEIPYGFYYDLNNNLVKCKCLFQEQEAFRIKRVLKENGVDLIYASSARIDINSWYSGNLSRKYALQLNDIPKLDQNIILANRLIWIYGAKNTQKSEVAKTVFADFVRKRYPSTYVTFEKLIDDLINSYNKNAYNAANLDRYKNPVLFIDNAFEEDGRINSDFYRSTVVGFLKERLEAPNTINIFISRLSMEDVMTTKLGRSLDYLLERKAQKGLVLPFNDQVEFDSLEDKAFRDAIEELKNRSLKKEGSKQNEDIKIDDIEDDENKIPDEFLRIIEGEDY